MKYFLNIFLLPILVLVVGLFTTNILWNIQQENLERELETSFTLLAGESKILLEDKIREFEDVILGIRGLFVASTFVDRNEFKRYVESLNIENRFPTVKAVSYVQVVEGENLEEFIEVTQNDTSLDSSGYPNFDTHPKDEASIYYIVDYIVPRLNNEAAIGLNLGFDPNRLDALLYARDNNIFSVTEPIQLVQQTETRHGFIMMLPLYNNGDITSTLEQRRESNSGFITVVFEAENLISQVLSNYTDRLHFSVFDSTDGGYSLENELYKTESQLDYISLISKNEVISLHNREWTITVESSPNLKVDEGAAALPKTIAFAGVLVSLLLSGIVLVITLSRKRALKLVDKRTSELRNITLFQEAILDSALHSIITIDIDGTITSFNSGAERLLGYSSEEMVAKNSPAILHDPNEVVEHAKELSTEYGKEIKPGIGVFIEKAKRGESEEREWTYITKNKKRIPVLLSVTALRDDQDQITGYLGIAEDISARIEAERELENFKLAVESSTDGVLMTTPDAEIVYANPAWQKKTGYTLSEVIGKNAKLSQSGKTPESVYKKMWASISKGKEFISEEIINKTKDGTEYPVHLAIYPLKRNNVVEYYVGVEQDITERVAIDKAKTEFVSLASHQLRTPLSAINWFAQMLEAGDAGKLNKEQKLFAKQILEANERMVALVDSLLNVSRVDLGTFAIEPQKMKLSKIADSVLKELAPAITTKKHKIKKKYGKDVPEILVDEKLTRIIFQNYISNAVKYSPEGGTVTVSIQKTGKFVEISVKDTGYGVPKAQESRIFEKLFRADNVREMETDGTGLGLYIVKAIAEEVGGKAWFESVEKKGSTFYATIPLAGMRKKKGNKELS